MANARPTSLTFEDAADVAQLLKIFKEVADDAGHDDDDVFDQTTDAPPPTHYRLLAVRSVIVAAVCLVYYFTIVNSSIRCCYSLHAGLEHGFQKENCRFLGF